MIYRILPIIFPESKYNIIEGFAKPGVKQLFPHIGRVMT